ncbi:hypothetical protein [Hydrogenophaga laconesensis]|uniref:Uncharacterized protein n=1 Tax=Hydrogenophaga laconesensis TaxID=1805971 RepID=A0ABU1VJA9_9BURK|nr:hypothetical protein [Hydrogenophaga laconesensis]MDR7097574.1 hypothetical protein [Hydrogenophaga laconesensis]
MSQADITRLVVSEAFTLNLGQAVGQGLSASDHTNTLQWRDGKWQGATTLLSRITLKKRSRLLVLKARGTTRVTTRVTTLAGAALALALAGIAIGVLLRQDEPAQASLSPTIPQEPAALPVLKMAESVRTLDEPFQPSAQDKLLVIQTHEGPVPKANSADLPIGAPAAAAQPDQVAALPIGLPKAEPSPLPSTKRAEPVAQSAKTPSSETPKASKDAPKASNEPKPPAVILDVTEERTPKPAGPQPSAPAAGKAAPASVVEPRAASAQPTAQGKGLLAITPDGKYAVFTDTATRLPKQFKIGEKLPNGDMIKSIDVKQGKVFAGAKEYSLE